MNTKLITIVVLLISLTFLFAETADGMKDIEYYLEGALPALNADEINSILQGNVFEYFNLDNEYNTPLKKGNFKGTLEYKTLLDSLSAMKQEVLTNRYYVREQVEFTEYNLSSGKLRANTNNSDAAVYSFHDPRVVDGYLFENLPYERETVLGANWYSRSFYITAKQAQSIELETCNVYVIFSIAGSKKSNFNTPRLVSTHDGPYAKNIKIIVTRSGDSEVQFIKDI